MPATPVPCLLGPTASGKTELGIRAARRTCGEVISCDAFGIYTAAPTLTAAPDAPADVPHHLVRVRPADAPYSAATFLEDADATIAEIRARGNQAWIVGGTALYLRTWLKGIGPGVARSPTYRAALEARAETEGRAALHAELARVDPERAAVLHPNDLRRVVRALEIHHLTGRPASERREEWEAPNRVAARLIGLRPDMDWLDARIAQRTRAMFAGGVLEEVAAARKQPTCKEFESVLGWSECVQVLDGELDAAEAVERLAQRTRRFARRQMTFFRSFRDCAWIDIDASSTPEALVARVLELAELPRAAQE